MVYGIYPPDRAADRPRHLRGRGAAAREQWAPFGGALAIMAIATGSAFAGPVGVWLSDGVGCCVLVLGHGAAQAWQLRAARLAA